MDHQTRLERYAELAVRVGANVQPGQLVDVIARFDMAASIAFWASAFDIVSVTNGQTYSCNGATAGQLTICVMPR